MDSLFAPEYTPSNVIPNICACQSLTYTCRVGTSCQFVRRTYRRDCNGRPVGTRTPDLYRVNILLVGWVVGRKSENGMSGCSVESTVSHPGHTVECRSYGKVSYTRASRNDSAPRCDPGRHRSLQRCPR